jgi:methionine-rich copper-binding protein CopC
MDWINAKHTIYNKCSAAPSERAYASVNDSPEALTFSWEVTTTPVAVTGKKPTASITIDSTKVDAAKLAALETILYGNTGVDPRLPLPDEIATLFASAAPSALALSTSVPADAATAVVVSSNITLTFNNKVVDEAIVLMSAAGVIVAVTKTWDATGKILTIDPTSNLTAATTYLIAVSGVTDIYGQALAPVVRKFTTA